MDFGTGFISDLAGGEISELVSKYGAKYVANGLKKLNMSDSFIKKVTGIDLNAKKTPVSTYAGYQNPVSSSNKGVGKTGGKPSSPEFVVTPNGESILIPKGATGPVDVVNPAGKTTGSAYTGGKGGANGQVSNVRIMDPTPARGKSPGYPNGYVKYENKGLQGVDPVTGKTIPNSQSHFSLK